ncbi:MAG: hypothetical protein SOZ00_02125 [Tidjanibacter sp.]|nr:hypothetical protein [Tidjanibacter sp.]
MMPSLKTTITILLFLLLPASLWGQQGRGTVGGKVTDSATGEALAGAEVELRTPTDTLYASARRDGTFVVPYSLRSKSGSEAKLTLRITFLGYKPFEQQLSAKEKSQTVAAALEPQALAIDALTVRGKIQMISIKGDTITFNAAAIKSMQDDNLGDLLSALPGVKVDGGTVTVNNEPIDFVLINGNMVFGTDQSSALRNVTADEVERVKVYSDSNRVKRTKVNVMDIGTRFTFDSRTNLSALLGGGVDNDRPTDGSIGMRYALYGNYEYNSREKKYGLSYSSNDFGANNLTANINTLTRVNNGTGKSSLTKVNATYEWRKLVEGQLIPLSTFRVIYSFTNNNLQRESRTQKEYFATNEWQSRSALQSGTNQSVRNQHQLMMHYDNNFSKQFAIEANASGSLGRSTGLNRTVANTSIDNAATYSSNLTVDSDQLTRDLSGGLVLSSSIGKHLSVNTSFSFSSSSNSTDGNSIDTLSSSTTRTFVNTLASGYDNSVNGRLSVSYRKNGWNIDARYSLGYTNSSFVRTAFDNLTGLVDPVMTADYSRNYVSHSPMIYTYYETALQSVVIDFSLAYDIEQMQNAEHASGSLPYGKTFAALLPGLGLTYSNKNDKLTFRITSAQELPSIEMLRNALNTTNPYYLKAGNPLLDAPVSYNASLGYSNYFPKHTISITSELEAKLTRGAISSRTTYFNTPTTLAAYDNYVAPAGSQLNSYCNAGDAVDLRFKGLFSKGFSSIKIILNLTPQLLYNRTPSYFGNMSRPEIALHKKE